MSKENKLFIVLISFFSFTHIVLSQPEYETWITDEIETSIKLHIEAIKIMDSLSEHVWPDWDYTDRVTYFIGAPGNNAVLINPICNLPQGFIPYSDDYLEQEIFIREKSNMDNPIGGTEVQLDGNFYEASSLMPFSIDTILYNYFNSELDKITNNEQIKHNIDNFIRSPENYISMIIHETFHFYQEKKEICNFYSGNPKYYKRSRINAYSYIEGMLLQRALYAGTKQQLIDIVHQFIAVRHRKSKELTLWQRCSEKANEFIEGIAQYITVKYSELMVDLDYKPQIIKENEKGYCSFNWKNEIRLCDSLFLVASIKNTDYQSSKQYYYGQAQAKILDMLCNDKWKKEIMEENIYLIDLLIKYSNFDNKQYKNCLEKAVKHYNYKNLLKYIRRMNPTESSTIVYN